MSDFTCRRCGKCCIERLQKKRNPNYRAKNRQGDHEQAMRVAWRQILRWVQAQFALINTGMVEAAEVFLPYVQVGIEQTLYSVLKAGEFKNLLPAHNG